MAIPPGAFKYVVSHEDTDGDPHLLLFFVLLLTNRVTDTEITKFRSFRAKHAVFVGLSSNKVKHKLRDLPRKLGVECDAVTQVLYTRKVKTVAPESSVPDNMKDLQTKVYDVLGMGRGGVAGEAKRADDDLMQLLNQVRI